MSGLIEMLSSNLSPKILLTIKPQVHLCLSQGRIITKKTTLDEKEVEENVIESFTYRQCFERAELLGKSILGLKLEFTESTQGMRFIGIYAKNRMEWLLTDLACTLFGVTSVPLYDTLGV
jgi:long-subunit acyl-CoA synthetase (AMP-forming)